MQRTSTLITLSAAICAVLSLLSLAYVPWLMLAAPGYWPPLNLLAELLGFSLPPALGICGLVTSLGLFRRKPWARVSIQVIAAVLILNSLLAGLLLATHSDLNAVWFAAQAVLMSIGISWLVFFNARNARAAFASTKQAGV